MDATRRTAPSVTDKHACLVRRAWLTLLALLFAVWWGGLTFYAMVVVPVGSGQIGETDQGFITQQVTLTHNALLTAMTIGILIEAWRRRCVWLWAVAGGLAVITVALLGLHAQLTEMMDFSERSVPDSFYSLHAAYLWVTTAEWTIGLAVPLLTLPTWPGQTGTESRECTASILKSAPKVDDSTSSPD